MTAHRAAPSRTRRRRSAHASTRGRKGPLWGGLAALALLGATGFAAVGWTSADRPDSAARPEPTGRAASGPAPPSPSVSPPSPTVSPSRPSADPSEPVIPATGPGTFTTASGTSAKVGTGRVLRYRVQVEDGLKLSAAAVAEQVERILADRRGWTADGHSAFQRVSGTATDFVVRVATPGTVDKICGQYGLDTGGEVNCNVAKNVMVNLKRWELATPVYAKDVTSYRALIINHEVGHFLGHGHVGCPGPGRPAPAMMQQIKGMHGCVPNVWPYDDDGQYVTGPADP
ncbi:DUF3152 domain-containing protein [Streptomyces sp. MMG1533]|uniref:DUF3152 domain-containing protein n=1 Tax=Streptomyces sp. MMG1533 TaxID=1415546 RepID=UPI000AA9D4FB|nr:DUF3152 domain-containing protein [Streptomyces sp. MMG1533]